MLNLPLKAEIIRKCGSQAQFARDLGIHDSGVSRVVRGWKELSDEQKAVWADILQVEVGEIFSEGGGSP